jgi:hypothetical protein
MKTKRIAVSSIAIDALMAWLETIHAFALKRRKMNR